MIKIENLSKKYGRVSAVENISLNIPRGETIALLGPSGSGKTTLLRVVAGFEQPTSGKIYIDNKLASSPDYTLEPHLRDISAVFQTPALWPNMTVVENIEYVKPLGQVTELIDRVGLTGLTERYPNELSGGEARRASIVRALVSEKKYLLLDEPLVNLNPELKKILHDVIIEEARRRSLGVLYISHDASELEHADQRYLMSEGKIAEE